MEKNVRKLNDCPAFCFSPHQLINTREKFRSALETGSPENPCVENYYFSSDYFFSTRFHTWKRKKSPKTKKISWSQSFFQSVSHFYHTWFHTHKNNFKNENNLKKSKLRKWGEKCFSSPFFQQISHDCTAKYSPPASSFMSCWLCVRLTCKGTRGRSPGRSTGRGRWRPLWTGKAHTAAWWSGRRHWWLCETSEQQQQQSQHTQHLDLQTEMWSFPFSFSTWKQKSISTSCLKMKMIN